MTHYQEVCHLSFSKVKYTTVANESITLSSGCTTPGSHSVYSSNISVQDYLLPQSDC